MSENGVDASAILEEVSTGDPVSVLGEWMSASLGRLSVGKLLSTLVLLLACLAAVRLAMALVERLAARSSMDGRVRRYVIRGVRTLLYLLAALIVAGSLGIDVTA